MTRRGNIHYEGPPSYEEVFPALGSANGRGPAVNPSPSKWNPRFWRKRNWIALAVILGILLIVIIAVTVTNSKRNAYPNYSAQSYSLKDTYSGESFFDNFDYFTGFDPAGGFVHYVPQEQAEQLNLTYASSSTAVLKVDTTVGPESVPNASTGRFSVRVESKKTYSDGLFIFDVRHTPFGCGTWPALWLTDPSNWPIHGEIDLMEGINNATDGNQVTLHTGGGCSMDVKRKQTFKSLHSDCNHESNDNAGCGVSGNQDTFGQDYNDNGGGLIALEWRDAGIRVWQFSRENIPIDITNKAPTPNSWGTAAADFPDTDCNIGSHFKNNSIIINIDLCGDLIYGSYDKSGCPGNCTDFVANNPSAFANAFWEFGAFEVYQAS